MFMYVKGLLWLFIILYGIILWDVILDRLLIIMWLSKVCDVFVVFVGLLMICLILRVLSREMYCCVGVLGIFSRLKFILFVRMRRLFYCVVM